MIYGGTRGHVFAIDPATGAERWRTKLSTGFLFNVAYAGDVMVMATERIIIAGCNGHVWGLDPRSGEIRWHNGLGGLGNGAVTLSTEGMSIQYVHKHTQSNS
ncbi:MAG TPA: PQQ-binding-like beta-propeller repeat protein [Planctomycetota bacterium]|nr:PQQ-binding-like beta-propeller repeat protein [Planctomycetota bacterium]